MLAGAAATATAQPSAQGAAALPDVSPSATDQPDERFQALGQATYVRQQKASFNAAYSGPNSLRTEAERSYSYTLTGSFGWRLFKGTEFYLNPEVAAGVPLSSLTGFGGFPNGELARTSGSDPSLYIARLMIRQTWGFGGGSERLESDANQLATTVDRRRLVMTVGIMPLIDIFDRNAYSHDARTQFMNWSLVTQGSYDFAADARGYTRGVALEWTDLDWSARAGRFEMPRQSNGTKLNSAIARSFGDQIELERRYTIAEQAGAARILMFRNRAVMGQFTDALAYAQANGGTPDVANVRRDQAKWGWNLNFEQALGRWGGAFVRVGANNDRSETFAYTEIGASRSAGIVLDGGLWGRGQDTLGIAGAENRLSGAHAAYLAAGGLGFFLGDGALNYRPERIFETYYAMRVWRELTLSANYQHVVNPGYNGDRGPVNIFALRAHIEF